MNRLIWNKPSPKIIFYSLKAQILALKWKMINKEAIKRKETYKNISKRDEVEVRTLEDWTSGILTLFAQMNELGQ